MLLILHVKDNAQGGVQQLMDNVGSDASDMQSKLRPASAESINSQ